MQPYRFMRIIAGLAALAFLPHSATAQTYPSRNVTLVVPVGPGGAPDLFARLLGEHLQKRLGQSVVIENRPGVGGNLAMQAVVRAGPDGHSLLLMTTPHAINATLYPDLGANLIRDIVPVTGLVGDNFVMVVTPTLAQKTLAEFLAYAKSNPGYMNMGSSGTGNLSHLAGELFKMRAGVDMVHVPYRSSPGALADVMTGTVDVMFDAIPSARGSIEAGKLRALGVTGATENPTLPGIPPIADMVRGYEVTGWMGIGVAQGTPARIVDLLAREISSALTDPVVKARLADIGSNKLELNAEDFAKLINDDVRKWAQVIKHAGIKPK